MSRVAALVVAVAAIASACGGSPSATTRPPDPPPLVALPPTPDPTVDPSRPPVGPGILGPVFVSGIDVEQTGDDRVIVRVRGDLPTPCHVVHTELTAPDAEGNIGLEVWSEAPTDAVCIQVLAPFSVDLPVDISTEGDYRIVSGGKVLHTFRVTAGGFADGVDEHGFAGIFPVADQEAFLRLADEVAGGHQPWLLDPASVAAAYLQGIYGQAPVLETITAGSRAEALWGSGRVSLHRPGPANALWVVTASHVSGLEVVVDQAVGDALFLTLSADRRGTAQVKVGYFAAEWIAQSSFELVAGEDQEAVLPVPGSGPDPLLLHIEFVDLEGREFVAQYRVGARVQPDEDP